MSEKDIETIITEILASSQATVGRRKSIDAGGRKQPDRRPTYIPRPRRSRSPRNPLYTSLRLIILGVVILLVPLLFSVKKVPPSKSTITGAIAPDQTVIAQMVDAQRA